MKKPIIGLTADWREHGEFSVYPWYALRQNYFTAIEKAGGIAIMLPHNIDATDDYLKLIDGLLVTGGDFDVDPRLYGADEVHETISTLPERSNFEYKITRSALEKEIPILGICGGQQLLNVALGGTLVQHIPDAIQNCLPHSQPNPRCETSHAVEINSGTHLHKLLGTTKIDVNSAHHQAVAKPGNNAIINAIAPDNVTEGIEVSGHRFCIGVQWHPEFLITEADWRLLDGFIKAAK
jgi:putative glutamine amidotransferase